MNGNHAGIVLARVVDRHRVPEGRVGIEQVLGARGERNPLCRRRDGTHELSHGSPCLLHRSRRARAGTRRAASLGSLDGKKTEKGDDVLPLVEGRPGHLNRANDALLEVLRVLLHDDDALLQRILLVHLLLKLTSDETVGVPVIATENASAGRPSSRTAPEAETHQGSSLA